jgi:hypothetical protein
MLSLEGESMMFNLKKLTLTLGAAALPLGAAHAELHDRGRGLIYDDVMNITWMADSNYAITSGFFESEGIAVYNGQVGWYDAMLWVNTLEYGGYGDWRLPSPLNRDGSYPADTDFGCNIYHMACDTSELGYMFYRNLGVPYSEKSGPVSILAARNIANLALFKNLQPKIYWANLRDPAYLGVAFAYDFGWGRDILEPTEDSLSNYQYGWGIPWAVRDGDVIDLSPVPEPQTAALMLAGVGLTGWAARRRRAAVLV